MAVQEESVQPADQKVDPEIEAMIQAGVHFGHKTSKTHPKMMGYIAGIRNTIHVINLEKTKTQLEAATAFLRQLQEEGKIVLFVGTKPQLAPLVQETAKALEFPYMTERWIGGTLTNFSQMTKRFERFQELNGMRANEEEWEKYTKKEQAMFEKELAELETKFGGIKDLQRIPDALFIIDLDENELAVREAKAKNVPVVAIVDTNINPEGIDYPIPANDDAITSVAYILEKITYAVAGIAPTASAAPAQPQEQEAEAESPNQEQE